jgi:type I restriction enzyme S subunit
VHDIAKVNATSLQENGNSEKSFYYIDLSSVNKGTIDFPTEKMHYRDLPSRARRMPHFGDVIMSTVRPNLLGHAICDFDSSEYLCSTGFALLSPITHSDTKFIYQSLFGEVLKKQIDKLVTGSSYPAINSSQVSELELIFPDTPEEREKIGNLLMLADKELDLLSQKQLVLVQQKKALMQKLLTGEIRVKV